jgi:NDP-sugar pyrophosphorylase family protein
MVPIGGKPLLQHHIEMLKKQGVTEFIVNLHYKPESITGHFGDGSRYGVRMTYSHEPELLGTAGAVKKMESHLRDGMFLLFYGDNLLRVDIGPLAQFHRDRQALATLALFESAEPWTGGVVETDATGRITRFREKPDRKDISTNLINAGIYALEPRVLDAIPAGAFYDFGKDLFPKLLAAGEPMFAMKPDAYIRDIGTPERLAQARKDYEEGLLGA